MKTNYKKIIVDTANENISTSGKKILEKLSK